MLSASRNIAQFNHKSPQAVISPFSSPRLSERKELERNTTDCKSSYFTQASLYSRPWSSVLLRFPSIDPYQVILNFSFLCFQFLKVHKMKLTLALVVITLTCFLAIEARDLRNSKLLELFRRFEQLEQVCYSSYAGEHFTTKKGNAKARL